MNKKPEIIGKSEILIGSKVIPYIIKRSMRSKLLWLRIKKETGLIVTIPRYYDLKCIESYLISKSKWILRAMNKIDSQKQGEINSFSNRITYLGIPLEIVKQTNDKNVSEIILEETQLVVNLDPCYRRHHSVEVEQWLKNQAAKYINLKTQFYSTKMGLKYNKVSIRDQKSRWGSCSRAKNLSFNWRLIMAPEPVIDYVIIHELCHLQEMNHSLAFWTLVDRYCADSKKYRKWLNQNSCNLHVKIGNKD